MWTLAVAVASALLVWPRLLLLAPTDDDGLMAGNALRFASGDMPYRDSFSALAPGADVLYGLWFRAVGSSYLTFRLLTALVLVAGGVLLFRLARTLLARGWAAGSALLWVAWCSMFFRIGPYHIVGIVLILAMALAVLETRRHPHALALGVGAGICGAAAVVMIQSLAPAAVAGLVAALLVAPDARRVALAMLAGAAGVAIVLLAWLALEGAIADSVRQSVVFVLDSYVPSHRLSLPWLPGDLNSFPLEPWAYLGIWPFRLLELGFWIVTFAAPLVLLALTGAAVVWRGRIGLPAEAVALLVVSSGLFVPVLKFAWAPHSWVNAALVIPLLVAGALAGFERLPRPGRRVGNVVLAIALGGAAAVPPALGVLVRTDARAVDRYESVAASGTTVYVHNRNAPATRRIIEFARAHPDDRIAFLPVAPAVLSPDRPRAARLAHAAQPRLQHRRTARPGRRRARERARAWVVYGALSQEALQAALPPAARRAGGRWRFERLLARDYIARRRLGEIVPLGPITLFELRPGRSS